MILTEENGDSMLYIDICMFSNRSYKDTLMNVYKLEYDENKNHEIFIAIKTSDSTTQLSKMGPGGYRTPYLTPGELESYLDKIQTKYDDDLMLGRTFTGTKEEQKLAEDIDRMIIQQQVKEKIEVLESVLE